MNQKITTCDKDRKTKVIPLDDLSEDDLKKIMESLGDGAEYVDSSDASCLDPDIVDYWSARDSRNFYIDFDIDDDEKLMKIGKEIIQLNFDDKDTAKKDLEPIKIWIYTSGGDLDQCLAFCDIIKTSRIPVITIALGPAMSAGFFILISGHKRYAFKHSKILIHQGSATFGGDADKLISAIDYYKDVLGEMESYTLENTSIQKEVLDEHKKTDWYINADDALKYHIIDGVIENISDIM